ncbi:flagellar motor switch protein FliN [Desulfofundulus thermosubterraneus]|uniref:Flagellar motor switch protein FliN/FliY n=1 Tax=Desulfofundulus thermosubterraneus DSM 16057 TaxID=1121432 RepID=A0A1M6FWR0_9FIRM|nr:flagellar motor switch protein FliN [Desulfofundulus thermosubterraneus]SHJ02040.1 flagellar motor switch protein FliN/FliY [Desulfofundulus thermosubterraneus DSM 16057]
MITEDEIKDMIKRMEGRQPTVKKVSFPPLTAPAGADRLKIPLDYLTDVTVTITVELGNTTMKVRDILRLSEGSVVELDRPAGDTVEVLINDQPFARGEVVVLGGNFGVRIESIHEIRKTRPGGEKQ